MKIQFFWNWAAMNPNVDTLYFRLYNDLNELFVDAGHWKNLVQKIMRKELNQPKDLFMTHCHSDHLLWLPHLLRFVKEPINIYCSENLKKKIISLMSIIWTSWGKKIYLPLFNFRTIVDKEIIKVSDWVLEPVDLFSDKDEQFGFILNVKWKKIVFFWDEAINILDRTDLHRFENCDWLICEAYCSERDKEIFDPHPKSHITSIEAANIAKRLDAKSLIIAHIAEKLEFNRVEQYALMKKEIKSHYSWEVYIPNDWDTISL